MVAHVCDPSASTVRQEPEIEVSPEVLEQTSWVCEVGNHCGCSLKLVDVKDQHLILSFVLHKHSMAQWPACSPINTNHTNTQQQQQKKTFKERRTREEKM